MARSLSMIRDSKLNLSPAVSYHLFLRNIPSAAQQELSRSGSRGTPHALRGMYGVIYGKNIEIVSYYLVFIIYVVRERLCLCLCLCCCLFLCTFLYLMMNLNIFLGVGTYLAGATKSPSSVYSQSVRNQNLPASRCEIL